MKIGIDARPLIGSRTGIANYLTGLLYAVAAVDQEHEFILYAPRAVTFQPPNTRWRARIHRGLKGTNGGLWLQVYGRRLIERDGVDLFWGAHFLLPLRLARRIPAIVTVYDLVPFLFPQTMEVHNYLALRILLRPSLARAQHVIAISRTTATDLQRRLSVPPEKVSVIPPGVAPQFGRQDPAEARRHVANAWGIVTPYLLSVGTLEPRKNLATLLKAYAALEPAMRKRWVLVVAGAEGWKNSSIRAAAGPLEAEGAVRFLGYVPDAELPWLYAGATALLFPSLYEGFGMPLIEAMASGLPVVASDLPVTREVAGDAALFIPPMDIRGWTRAIEWAIHDEQGRISLRKRGFERVRQYTFEASARRFLDVCDRFTPLAGSLAPAPVEVTPTRRGA
jgi:glycosyltransferase involved in cell wall biosynthesis